MHPYTFIRTGDSWYIDLPEYLNLGGKQEDLQMVAGADEILDLFAVHHDSVTLIISEAAFENADHLKLLEYGSVEEGGAFYDVRSLEGQPLNQTVWLCNVLLFVFGRLPNDIYIKKAP